MAGSHRVGPEESAGTVGVASAGSVLLAGTELVADSGTDLGTGPVEGTDHWWEDGTDLVPYHRTY